MRFTTHKRRSPPAVIIVSLIDVLIVVLIYLVASTTFRKSEPTLRLALPESKQAKPGPAGDARPFVVTVTTNYPFFYVESRPLFFDRLQAELITAARRNPQVKVAIRADRNAPFGEVIRVIDAAKIAEVGSINAITERAR